VVCVSNLTLNKTEYKSLSSCSYDDFLDWIWVSCNFLPFMSLVIKNRHEMQQLNRMRSRNAFDVLLSTLDFMGDQIIADNLKVGKLLAKDKKVDLRLFYTPKVLTTNSLVFDRNEMLKWWEEGWLHAQSQLTLNSQA